MATVTRIDPQALKNTSKRLRTCAYCRVSSNSADQLNSYATQVRYYTKAIREKPEWEFVDVFADEGITGTRADKRIEFQRMLKLCEHGKIDFIITKSISRFARNVPECLEFARKLKRQGIGIFFEKESIVVLLKLIGRCLSRISRRYSGVHGNPSQFRLFENVIFR